MPEIAGTPPHPRSHHTATLVEFDEEEDGDAEKKIFIIGGCARCRHGRRCAAAAALAAQR